MYNEIYSRHPQGASSYNALIELLIKTYKQRGKELKKADEAKELKGEWFLDNKLAGMSLYVDRFCGNLVNLQEKLPYFNKLGVNLLHLMPVFESPEGESDGGYAVSDFRKVASRFGTNEQLESLQATMLAKGMYFISIYTEDGLKETKRFVKE